MDVLARRSDRVHVAPERRRAIASLIAQEIVRAFHDQAPPGSEDLLLCPGCTMITIFDVFIELAWTQDFSAVRCAPQLGNVLQACATTPTHQIAELAESLR